MKLNLGCGNKKLRGYCNADINPNVEPDKIYDLNKKTIFNPNTFIEIKCFGVLNYVDDIIFSLNEIYKILKDSGELYIKVDHFRGMMVCGLTRNNIRFSVSDIYTLDKEFTDYYLKYPFSFKVKACKIEFYKGFHVWNHAVSWFVNLNRKTQRFYENSFLSALFRPVCMTATLIK